MKLGFTSETGDAHLAHVFLPFFNQLLHKHTPVDMMVNRAVFRCIRRFRAVYCTIFSVMMQALPINRM